MQWIFHDDFYETLFPGTYGIAWLSRLTYGNGILLTTPFPKCRENSQDFVTHFELYLIRSKNKKLGITEINAVILSTKQTQL